MSTTIKKTPIKKSPMVRIYKKDKLIESLQNETFSLQNEINVLKLSHKETITKYEQIIQELNNSYKFKLKYIEDKVSGNSDEFVEYYFKLTKLLDSIDELRILYLM